MDERERNDRLRYLSGRLQDKQASQAEKDEYMTLMLGAGLIDQSQYDDYRRGENAEFLLKLALTVGLVFLLLYLIDKSK
jgi:hypothetical protein